MAHKHVASESIASESVASESVAPKSGGSRAVLIVIAATVTAVLIAALVFGTDSLREVSAPESAATQVDDGELPDGATAYDDYAGITRLDPDLLAAVRAATDAAAEDGIDVFINAGWRSKDYQQRLIDEAIEKYGSWSEASRWVATIDGSAHVSGEAVDIGSYDAAEWFQDNGPRYDLCQIFDNEAWHFELRPGASEDGCPKKYWDASDDPRNQ